MSTEARELREATAGPSKGVSAVCEEHGLVSAVFLALALVPILAALAVGLALAVAPTILAGLTSVTFWSALADLVKAAREAAQHRRAVRKMRSRLDRLTGLDFEDGTPREDVER